MELLSHINSIKSTRCKLNMCYYRTSINLPCSQCPRTKGCLRSCVLRNGMGSAFICKHKDECVSFINFLRIKREVENGRDIKDDTKL